MNKYGLPLDVASTQTILPAMTKDGLVRGWYPITETIFDGTETTFSLSDIDVPLMSVTVDTEGPVKQYMAAVWNSGLREGYRPWGSKDLIAPGDGDYSWWSLPTETWVHHFGKGMLITGLTTNMNQAGAGAPSVPTAPAVVTPQQLTWKVSLEYQAFNGACTFFDFNWMTLFTSSPERKNLRIEITTQPAPLVGQTVSPMLARVIGTPITVGKGVNVFDTIRVVKNVEIIPVGAYVFGLKIYNEAGLSAVVQLTVNVL